MGTTITFRRGENDPTSGSGLTLAEPAFNTTLKTFHIGLGYGVTAAWVGAPISGASADIAAGITYKIPSAAAVLNYISGLCFGITNGVRADTANTFTALQSFSSGISASGITVNGNMSVTGNFTVSGGVTFTTSETVLIEDNIITLNSNVTGSPSENAGIEIERGTSANVQLLWNESSDRWTFTNDGSTYYDLPTSVVTSFNGNTGAVQGVSSFNGLTGAVGGVCAAQANTFTALQTFNSGISASGGTFGSDITVSGINAVRIGVGPGNIGSNVCLGGGAFAANTTGGTNVAVGASSLAANTTGTANVAVGRRSLFMATNGSGNVGIGNNALGSLVNGSNNIGVGRLAADSISAATGGIYIGYQAIGTDTATNEIVIGTQASGFGSNTAVIGANTQTAAYIYGLVHAVGGVSAPGGTFSALTRFTAGISASGLTVGGSEGIEITRRLPAGAIIGEVNFLKGLGAELRVGNISGSEMVFSGRTASVFSPNTSLTIDQGATEGAPTTGDYAAAVRFVTKTGFNAGTATLAPVSGYTTDRTINLPNANGILALTSQLMGTVNGSTAATTAVTSFNGRTGAVTGASLGANTFTELNTFNAGISVSGGATFASTVRIVGTLSGTGATFSGGVSAAAFNGVAMNTGNDTFTNASLGIGAFALASNNGGYNNTAVGWAALSLNTTGTENAAFGESALTNCTTGSSNVAFGAGTLYENTFGSFNLAIGALALFSMNGGNRNTAIGSQSLRDGTTGSDQISIGYRAGSLVEGGLRNVAIGNEAMLGTATPVFYDCVSVGYRSLYSMSAAGASFNTAIGTESMRQTTSGSRNTGVGSNSLRSITTANEVIGIGADAGRYRGATGTTILTTGTGGIYIGVDSRASGLAQTNEIVIGRSAVGLGSNTAVIGATAQTAAYIYGLVHAVGGVSAPGGTFSALTRFTAGISAAGGVTFSGTIASDTGYRITSNAINAQTGTTYTFLDGDNGKVVTFNNGSAVTVTIPTGLPVGFNCTAIQLGAGQVGFTAASGVTMNAYASAYKISGQHGAAALISYTTNIFNLSGTLSA